MSFYFLNLFATCGSVQKARIKKNSSIHYKLSLPEKNLMIQLEGLAAFASKSANQERGN